MGCSGECCFGVMYGELYGVCDFVVLSAVEVCVDYGSVNVLHVCLDFGVVYGVGVYVNVCGVVCIVVSCLFPTSGCYLWCWDVVECCCDFCLKCVVGGVPLWAVCVFRCVDVVCSILG